MLQSQFNSIRSLLHHHILLFLFIIAIALSFSSSSWSLLHLNCIVDLYLLPNELYCLPPPFVLLLKSTVYRLLIFLLLLISLLSFLLLNSIVYSLSLLLKSAVYLLVLLSWLSRYVQKCTHEQKSKPIFKNTLSTILTDFAKFEGLWKCSPN